ncbi:MAG: hypothetical protein KF833_24255 [Verrucomicrobiae bacterium]|nr:hypothetical protein [Verrucomicrobiae bacterium]
MKSILLGPLAVLLVAGAMGLQRHGTELRARHELDALRPLAAQADRLAREIEAWRLLDLDTAELDRLRARKLDLLRLRGEIGDLRQAARLTPDAAQRELHELHNRADTAEAEAQRLEGIMQFDDQSRESMTSLNLALQMALIGARTAGGLPPASWDDIRERLARSPPEFPGWTDAQRDQARRHWLEQIERLPADRFEVLPSIAPDGANLDAALRSNHTLLLRERTPRPHPDGGWVRAYGFLSGRVAEAISPDGDFTAWERAETTPDGPP